MPDEYILSESESENRGDCKLKNHDASLDEVLESIENDDFPCGVFLYEHDYSNIVQVTDNIININGYEFEIEISKSTFKAENETYVNFEITYKATILLNNELETITRTIYSTEEFFVPEENDYSSECYRPYQIYREDQFFGTEDLDDIEFLCKDLLDVAALYIVKDSRMYVGVWYPGYDIEYFDGR